MGRIIGGSMNLRWRAYNIRGRRPVSTDEENGGLSNMRIGIQLSKSGTGAGLPLRSAGSVWVLYILMLVPGVFVSLLAQSFCPLLDARRTMGFLLGAFLFVPILQILSIVLKLPNESGWWLRAVYHPTGLVHSPIQAGPYYLWVTSWRPGRTEEDFNIGSREFDRARIGKTVTVELHSGFFGLPWRGDILAE